MYISDTNFADFSRDTSSPSLVEQKVTKPVVQPDNFDGKSYEIV